MFSFLEPFKPYLYGVVVLAVIATVGYVKYLQTDLEETKNEVAIKDQKIKDKDEDIKNLIDGYEKTLAIEKEISSQKAITQEQKEVVITKYKTLVKEVEKRGEIKQDEKSNFTIVTF